MNNRWDKGLFKSEWKKYYCIENQDLTGFDFIRVYPFDEKRAKFFICEPRNSVAIVYYNRFVESEDKYHPYLPCKIATFIGYDAKERAMEMLAELLKCIDNAVHQRKPLHGMFCCWKWDKHVVINENELQSAALVHFNDEEV